MFLSPLHNQAQGFCGEFPFHHTKILNQKSSLLLVVLDMKMWRIMLIEVQLDDHSQKTTDFRHSSPQSFGKVQRRMDHSQRQSSSTDARTDLVKTARIARHQRGRLRVGLQGFPH